MIHHKATTMLLGQTHPRTTVTAVLNRELVLAAVAVTVEPGPIEPTPTAGTTHDHPSEIVITDRETTVGIAPVKAAQPNKAVAKTTVIDASHVTITGIVTPHSTIWRRCLASSAITVRFNTVLLPYNIHSYGQ